MNLPSSIDAGLLERLGAAPPALIGPEDFQELQSALLALARNCRPGNGSPIEVPERAWELLQASEGKHGIFLAFAQRLLSSPGGFRSSNTLRRDQGRAELLRARMGQWLLHSSLHDLYLRMHTHLPAWTQPERQWYAQFRQRAAKLLPDAETRAARSRQWSRQPTISILLATHGTRANWFQDAVESVFAQCYGRWQLCICDDASGDSRLARVLDDWSAADPRVKIHRATSRLGVSAALNEAAKLATGDFVTFLDHDDLLDEAALHSVVEAMQKGDPELVYTDEDFIDEQGQPHRPHFKPGWSPQLLNSCMYLGHLIVMRRELFHGVGGFRSSFDGAQDYDLALRAAEQRPRVAHVPRVAYHWRMHGESVAKSRGNKPYTHLLGQQAIEESLHRTGYAGLFVQSNSVRNLYHVRAREVVRRDHVEVIRLPITNTTTGPGHSHSIEEANRIGAKSGREYLLLLDEGIEPAAGASVDVLVGALQRPGVGIAGGKILDRAGCIVHVGGALGGSGSVSSIHKGELASAKWPWLAAAREVTCLTHAALCVRKSTFDELGGFAPHFPPQYRIADFCLRAARQGIFTLMEPAAAFTYAGRYSTVVDSHSWEDWVRFMRQWGEEIAAGDRYYTPNLPLR